MDKKDLKLLEILQRQGRMAVSELADNLAESSCRESNLRFSKTTFSQALYTFNLNSKFSII